MKHFHLTLAEIWKICNGNVNRLTEPEWQEFRRAMWQHVEYVDRLKAMDEAMKTWAKTQEGKQ